MTHLPLIFPVIFSDEQFQKLDQIRNILTEMIIELNEISVCNRKLLQVDLSRSVFDINEIISYRNIKGYRWNSYILRMSILKMEYIIEVLSHEDQQKHLMLLSDLKNSQNSMLLILEQCFDEYLVPFR